MSDQSPTIVFRLDARSDRAPFRQLVDQVTDAFERGQIQAGDQLPSVREVVRQITINPNTVHRAYRELEHLGLAEGRLGLGTFVVDAAGAGPREYRSQSWRETLREGVALARSNGIGDNEIIEGLHGLLTSDAEARS
jgi:GntR family transcriptional regulator